jgi:large subunit ribosomal protein L17
MASHRKLGRPSNERVAMLRNLTTSFLKHGKIHTTEMRAKEVKSIAEKMITLAKKGDLHSRRQALSYLYDETVVSDLFTKVAPKYNDRNGGYTRILREGPRRGDAAEMVILELV